MSLKTFCKQVAAIVEVKAALESMKIFHFKGMRQTAKILMNSVRLL